MTEQQAQGWEKPIMLCKEELSFAHGDPMYCDHRINLFHSLSRFNGFACMWCWMLVSWHGEVKRETSHLFQYFCRRSLLTWWHAELIWIHNAIYKLTKKNQEVYMAKLLLVIFTGRCHKSDNLWFIRKNCETAIFPPLKSVLEGAGAEGTNERTHTSRR